MRINCQNELIFIIDLSFLQSTAYVVISYQVKWICATKTPSTVLKQKDEFLAWLYEHMFV